VAQDKAQPPQPAPPDDKDRLASYGISPDQTLAEPVIVPPDKVLTLSALDGAGKRGYVQLKPKTMDDVKLWIGVHDEIARRRTVAHLAPANIPHVQNAAELKQLPTADLRGLHNLAETFVHGDSRQVAQFTPAFQLLLKDAVIHGIFVRADIDVYGVLDIHNSVRLLWANRIRIWGNGKIRFHGPAKIDATSIEGKHKLVHFPSEILNAVSSIGILKTLEVQHG
jgi:hypothetical protein